MQGDSIVGSVAGLAAGGVLACLLAALLSRPAYLLFRTLRETVDVGTRVGIATAGSIGTAVGTVIGDIGMVEVGSHLTDGILTGLWQSGIVGFAFVVLYIVGYYRLPLYPINALWTVISYHRSNNDKIRALQYLQNSPLHRDECVFLHLPYLEKILGIIALIDVNTAKGQLRFIATERPQQIWAAEIVAFEIAMRDLASRENLTDIARDHRSQYLRQLILPELRRHKSVLGTLYTELEAAMEEAENYCRLNRNDGGTRTARNDVLDRMTEHLSELSATVNQFPFFTVSRQGMLEEVLKQWRNYVKQAKDDLNVPFSSSEDILDPYESGQPLKPLQDRVNPTFLGRDDIIRSIQTTLQKNSHANFSLIGAHRMGKSSILAQLPVMLGARYILVNCDVSLIFGKFTLVAFLQSLITEVATQVHEKGLSVQTVQLEKLVALQREDEEDVCLLVNDWLQPIEKWLKHHRRVLLIMFDEIERLDRRIRDTPHLESLLRWFRSLSLYHTNIALLFCGVKPLYRLGSVWNDNLRNFEQLKVTFLPSNAASKLIRLATSPRTGTVVFPIDLEEAIIETTHCHPYLIQALCSILIRILNDASRDIATGQDLRAAKTRLFDKYEFYFAEIWQKITKEQQHCLLTLRTLTSYQGDELAYQSDIEGTAIHHVLGHLDRHDVVVNEQGSYRLAVPLFAEWLSTERYRFLDTYDDEDDS